MMYDKERQELETRLAELNAREAAKLANLKEFAIDPDVAHLATVQHDTQCRQSHIDGCWWEYENSDNKGLPDWNRGAHAEYLQQARNTLIYTDYQTALVLTYVINGRTPPTDVVPPADLVTKAIVDALSEQATQENVTMRTPAPPATDRRSPEMSQETWDAYEKEYDVHVPRQQHAEPQEKKEDTIS